MLIRSSRASAVPDAGRVPAVSIGCPFIDAGSGSDTVIGTADATTDSYNGGSGTDTIDYSALPAAQPISVNLGTGAGLTDPAFTRQYFGGLAVDVEPKEGVRVPFREIALHPSANEPPVRRVICCVPALTR